MTALIMKPDIIPNISRVAALFSFEEAARMMLADMIAPENADSIMDMSVELSMVAVAAPSAAPALIPMICGSASGFLSMLCICIPDNASAPPASMAVTILGRRSLVIISMSVVEYPVNRSAATRPRMMMPQIQDDFLFPCFMRQKYKKYGNCCKCRKIFLILKL